jgi:hypothetical protein
MLPKCADFGMDDWDLERGMGSYRQRRHEEGLTRGLEHLNAPGEEVEECVIRRAQSELLCLGREVAHIEESLNTVARDE